MTNSERFTAAHKEAKRNQSNFGTYAQRFSIALKGFYLRARIAKKRAANKIKSEALAAKKQAISFAERKINRKSTQPTSSYVNIHHWTYLKTA